MISYVPASALVVSFTCSGFCMPGITKKPVEENRCSRELSAIDKAFAESMQDLQRNGSTPERCTSWRHQIGVMKKASDVFARCLEGEPRDAALAQMDGAITDFQSMMQEERCLVGSEGRAEAIRFAGAGTFKPVAAAAPKSFKTIAVSRRARR